MRQLVLADAGVARLARWHIEDDIRRGDLVPLLEEYNAGDLETINAVYVGGGQVSRRVRAFVDYMVTVVSSSPLFSDA